jgi:hypothetical protein
MGVDEERAFERLNALAAQIAILVLPIHEHVGADLQLGEGAELRVNVVRAGAAAGDERGLQIRGAELFND